MKRKSAWLLFVIALSPLCAQAKLFRNAYISFELPPQWGCQLEGTEWVCTTREPNKKISESIIVLTAKEVGPADTIAAYEAHLKSPRALPDKSNRPIPSKVLHVRRRLINNHQWVDGMHLGSEISTYYTRYLATIKGRLAILVTFSAHKKYYTKYSHYFLKAIQSLRVIAQKNLLSQKPQAQITTKPTPIAIDPIPEEDSSPPKRTISDFYTKLLALAMIIGAIAFYFLRPKKKKRKRSKK